MTDPLHVKRQGPPRSGEVVITDEELHNEDARWKEEREYTRIARHFFAMFLEMKAQYERGELQPPKNYEKEKAQYEKLIVKLKEAVNDSTNDATRFEEALALAEDEKVKLRARINELTIENGRLMEKLQGLGRTTPRDPSDQSVYSLRELLSEQSRQELDRLMKEIPRGS
jgi:chromosome segregation ATPase